MCLCWSSNKELKLFLLFDAALPTRTHVHVDRQFFPTMLELIPTSSADSLQIFEETLQGRHVCWPVPPSAYCRVTHSLSLREATLRRARLHTQTHTFMSPCLDASKTLSHALSQLRSLRAAAADWKTVPINRRLERLETRSVVWICAYRLRGSYV